MYRVAFQAVRRFRFARPAILAAVAICLTFAPLGSLGKANAAANKYAAYVIDVKSGKVLFSRNATSPRYPASLTKMMTLYMVFERLENGKLTLNSRFKVSKYAASRPPSKLGLRAGSSIRVRDAIYALVTKSANDVATTVAENIGGSEAKFAAMMTDTARALGMTRTTFKNASGLPNSKQKTTAADMALLGRALQDRFPKQYKYFSTSSFKYGKRRYGNHNKLLGRVKGVDGIKTGYTRASGFNLVTNVKTRDRHIVAVVMGGKSGRSRDNHMKSLIAKYLSKAKTGKRQTALVVPRAGTASKANYIQLAKSIRLPKAKTLEISQPLAMASLAPSIPAFQPASSAQMAYANPINLAALPRENPAKPDQQATASIPVSPKPRMTTAALAMPPLPRAANDPVGDLSTHSRVSSTQVAPSGWHIQLGAAPSLAAANKILSQARAKNERLLLARVNHTETVEKNNATLYRARFTGFESKSSARDACKILQKQKFACLALHP
ncbi:serine hydrolase [Cohaesibacter celericrescens]|uniref:serine hydrolase n=1 Tax=Cohaesibacter celericrescens TaxID=2067669 RepID=UPI003564E57F